MWDGFPGAGKSVPGRVRLEVDVRDIDLDRRDSGLRAIAAATEETMERRGVTVHTEVVNADAPAFCAQGIVDVLERACKNHQASYELMISRAYHD